MLDVRKGLKLELPDLIVELPPPPEVGSLFDLTLYVQNWGDTLRLKLVYNADLFSQERMAEMSKQLEGLLTQITDSPDFSIDQYSLVTTQSRQILPDPTIPLAEPEQTLLPQMIKEWVTQTPQQIAIVQNERHWTYEQLDQQAGRLARMLISKGLNPGDIVAVCGSRSFSLIASMIAVFLSGGVLLPIDPALPDQRKQLMLREASAKALIYIGAEKQQVFTWVDPESILFFGVTVEDLLVEEIAADLSSIAFPQISSSDPAYIFFTSGTTGIPKGVQGTHKGLKSFPFVATRHIQYSTPRPRCPTYRALL